MPASTVKFGETVLVFSLKIRNGERRGQIKTTNRWLSALSLAALVGSAVENRRKNWQTSQFIAAGSIYLVSCPASRIKHGHENRKRVRDQIPSRDLIFHVLRMWRELCDKFYWPLYSHLSIGAVSWFALRNKSRGHVRLWKATTKPAYDRHWSMFNYSCTFWSTITNLKLQAYCKIYFDVQNKYCENDTCFSIFGFFSI